MRSVAKWRSVSLALFLAGLTCIANAQLPSTSAGKKPGGAAFQGPLDIITTGAVGCWGFRALSAAKTNTAIIRLRDTTTTTEQDINALSNGNFDAASAATFLGGHSGVIAKLYDQSGNARDVTPEGGVVNAHAYLPNAIGSLSAMSNNNADNNYITAASATITLPFSVSASVKPNLTGANGYFFGDGAFVIKGIWRPGTPQLGIAGDVNEIGVSVTNNTNNAIQGLFGSGSTSFVRVNGTTSSTLTAISTSFSDTIHLVGPAGWQGNFYELCLYSGDKSSSFASVESNQRTYWGF